MVDFRNTVIIMTSNVGAREITTTAPLGFSSSGATGLNDDEIKTRVMSEVKRLFRPEFLNRIDEIIVFKSLTEDEIVEIVNLMVADLRDRLIEQNMTINMSDAANRLIAKEGTDLSFGARPLRRAIQRLLEDPISEQNPGRQMDERVGHRCRCGRREARVQPGYGFDSGTAQA